MLIAVLFLILPVLLAGLIFILYLKYINIPLLNSPLDGYVKINNKRIFGRNKTIKGPLFMSVFTTIFGVLIYQLIKNDLQYNLTNFQILAVFFFAGLAYSLGELPTSFIKRQLDINPGEKSSKFIFRILDIYDSLLFIALIYYLLLPVSLITIWISVLTGGLIHVLTDKLMIRLALKK